MKSRLVITLILVGAIAAAVALIFWQRAETYNLAPLQISGSAAPAGPPKPLPIAPGPAVGHPAVQSQPLPNPKVDSTDHSSAGATMATAGASPAGPTKAPATPVAVDSDLTRRNQWGTQQMYLAHASLRTDAVANPDSADNRKVLSTMVEKALARAKESEQPRPTKP